MVFKGKWRSNDIAIKEMVVSYEEVFFSLHLVQNHAIRIGIFGQM